MAGIFTRLFKMGQAEAHSVIDKFEDPIKLTEQGIRDLKKDLDKSLKSLAEVKAISIRAKREANEKKQEAADYEKKAMLLLKKSQSGDLDASEADRLATEALNKKEENMQRATALTQDYKKNEAMVAKLDNNVKSLKSQIGKWENELQMLKARAKVAAATKKLNSQMAKVDSSGTISMLEKMKDKVAEDEALAESYSDIASLDKSIDSEIDKALEGTDKGASSDALTELKAKMKIKE